MASRVGQSDLLAGGVAAAGLLLLVFALDLTPWLAVPLAVLVFVGGVALRSGRRRPDKPGDDARSRHLAYEAALANVAAIRALAPRIARPAAREQVGRIIDRSAQVLSVMRADANLTAAPLFNDQLMAPFRALLTEYVRLSIRDVRSAAAVLEQTETHDLPMIEQAVDAFYERLHRAQVIDLATLRDILEVNLESISAATPRRFKP